MPRSTVTFLTDFGLEDTFVGQMKAVVLSASPDAALVDLTHAVPPQSISTGAIHLRAAWHWFPEGTIHVVVVDPGVGTSRRAIGISYRDHFFLGPDNGILSGAVDVEWPQQAVELERPVPPEREISRTFHGRDVFAWAAGQLAAGFSLSELGSGFDPAEMLKLEIPEPRMSSTSATGEILFIDHWGNAVTNIPSIALGIDSRNWAVRCAEFAVETLSSTYAEVQDGAPLAAISSMDTVELAVRNGSAATRYDLAQGMSVEMTRTDSS